jgi:hypothetical protein
MLYSNVYEITGKYAGFYVEIENKKKTTKAQVKVAKMDPLYYFCCYILPNPFPGYFDKPKQKCKNV